MPQTVHSVSSLPAAGLQHVVRAALRGWYEVIADTGGTAWVGGQWGVKRSGRHGGAVHSTYTPLMVTYPNTYTQGIDQAATNVAVLRGAGGLWVGDASASVVHVIRAWLEVGDELHFGDLATNPADTVTVSSVFYHGETLMHSYRGAQ